jgi:hypothetical protein
MALRMASFTLLTLTACSSAVSVEPVLQIVSISPTGGAANVNVDSNVLITFNAELNTDRLNTESAYVLNALGELAVTDLLYAKEAWTLTLDPAGDLEKASDYTLVLTTALTSESKGALVVEVQSTFRTTGDDPQNAKPIATLTGNNWFDLEDGSCCVNLSGADSSDPEGSALTYSWRLDSQPASSNVALSSTADIETEFSPTVEGEYLVRLVVNDGFFDSDPVYMTISAGLGPGDTAGADTGNDDTSAGDSGAP